MSDLTIWGIIVIVWITLMGLLGIYYNQPDTVNYIQFEDGPPRQVTPNTQPPVEA